jgi:hypothetical protein
MEYLKSARRQFEYYKSLADKAMDQAEDEGLNWHPDDESNSIAVIIRHLHGNMLSRWTDFLTTDGEKPWRDRDAEFEGGDSTREALLGLWEAGWQCLFTALDSITDADLERIIHIRNDGHTILEAINRQIAHYAYHVGQIVWIARMQRRQEWQSLSIPRRRSGDYNAVKFSQAAGRRHFTDDLMK